MLNYGLLHESSIKINFLMLKAFKNIEREFVICRALNEIDDSKKVNLNVDSRDNLVTITTLTKQLDFALNKKC